MSMCDCTFIDMLACGHHSIEFEMPCEPGTALVWVLWAWDQDDYIVSIYPTPFRTFATGRLPRTHPNSARAVVVAYSSLLKYVYPRVSYIPQRTRGVMTPLIYFATNKNPPLAEEGPRGIVISPPEELN